MLGESCGYLQFSVVANSQFAVMGIAQKPLRCFLRVLLSVLIRCFVPRFKNIENINYPVKKTAT